MAMYENPQKVCIEFLKSSKGFGGRVIKLNYGPQAIPQQLVGRINDMNMWGAFMRDCATLAERHPYVIKPSGKQVCGWGLCFGIAAVIGCASINPDGGSYPQWEAEASQMLDRWRPSFTQAGLALSLQRTREHWIQIDVVGPPAMATPPPPKDGFQAQWNGEKLPQYQGHEQQGYATQQYQQQPAYGQPTHYQPSAYQQNQ